MEINKKWTWVTMIPLSLRDLQPSEWQVQIQIAQLTMFQASWLQIRPLIVQVQNWATGTILPTTSCTLSQMINLCIKHTYLRWNTQQKEVILTKDNIDTLMWDVQTPYLLIIHRLYRRKMWSYTVRILEYTPFTVQLPTSLTAPLCRTHLLTSHLSGPLLQIQSPVMTQLIAWPRSAFRPLQMFRKSSSRYFRPFKEGRLTPARK